VIEVIRKVARENNDKSVDTFDCLTEYNFDENSRREFKKVIIRLLNRYHGRSAMPQCRPKRRCFLPTAWQPLPSGCAVVTNSFFNVASTGTKRDAVSQNTSPLVTR